MEAEFVALTDAAKEMLWFDRILNETINLKIISDIKSRSKLYVDNIAAIDFVKSQIENHRTKHIDVKLFFVRDLIYKGTFDIKYIKSKQNLADIFTKPLTKNELINFREIIFHINKKD